MILLVCLAAPTKPLNLMAKTTDISATLSWKPPISNGGREDVFYLAGAAVLTYYSPTPPITNTLPLSLHLHL